MTPAAFVPLDEFPLNPNGKIDRGALPEPPRAETTAAYTAPRNQIEKILADLWGEVLGVEKVWVHDNFFELGGHSLAATGLMSKIREALKIDLPLRSLFEESTVAGLASRIDCDEMGRAVNYRDEDGWDWKMLVSMQPRGSRPPLFIVAGAHAEEEDFLRFLSSMIPHLGLDQPVYGFRAKGLDGMERAHRSVEEMAQDYAAELRQFKPDGPYMISGECVGGVVAYELAQILRRQGETVSLLLLMDTVRPTRLIDYWGRMINLMSRFKNAKNHLGRAWKKGLRGGVRYLLNFMRAKRKLLMPRSHEERQQSHIYNVEMNYPAVTRRYRPKPYPGKLTLLVNEEMAKLVPYLAWQDLPMGGVDTHVVPGDHKTRLTKYGKVTADLILSMIDKAQMEHGPAAESPEDEDSANHV